MLRDLISRYNQQANQVRPLVEEVVTQLDASAVPAEGVSERLYQALIELQNSYAAIRSRAGELLEATELPPQGVAVMVYQSAVEGSRRMQWVEILTRFSQVHTAHARYEDVLAEAQARADALLQQRSTLAENAVTPYAAFLHALELGKALNDDTPEANVVMDELERYEDQLGSRLVTGLCRGAFVLTRNVAAPEEEANTAEAPVAAPEEEADSAEAPVAAPEQEADSAEAPVVVPEGEADSAEASVVVPEGEADSAEVPVVTPAEETESSEAPVVTPMEVVPDIIRAEETASTEETVPIEVAAPVEATPVVVVPVTTEPMQNERDAVSGTTAREEETVSICNPITQHSIPSVNKLKDRISSIMEIAVVEALGVLHVVTPDLMLRVRGAVFGPKADVAATILKTMENRGFLCSYEVDGERLYCCAPMLSACMNKSDRYQLLNERVHNANQNPRREWRKPILQRPVLVAQDVLPLSTLRYFRKQAELVSALFQRSCNVSFGVKWDKDASCYQLSFKTNPSRLLKAIPVEEFLAMSPEDSQLLITTDNTLPAADLMSTCPAECRYFICDGCYVWDGAAWKSLGATGNLPADDAADAPDAAVVEAAPITENDADTPADAPVTEAAADVVLETADVEDAQNDTAVLPEESSLVEEAQGEEKASAEVLIPMVESAPIAEEIAEEATPVPHEYLLLPDGTLDYEAIRRVVQSPEVPSDEALAALVMALFSQRVNQMEAGDCSVYDALLLAASAASDEKNVHCKALSDQLKMATGLLSEKNPWTSLRLSETFANGAADPSMMLAAYAQALFTPADAHDHWLLSLARPMLRDYSDWFPSLPEFKSLFNILLGVQQVSKHGFTPAIIAQLGSNVENEAITQKLRMRARHYMEHAMTMAPTNTRGRQAGIVGVYEALFQQGSDLYDCMEIIAENRTDDFDFVDSVLQEYCLPQQDEEPTRNIDQDTIIYRLDAVYREKRWSLDAHSLYPEIQNKAVNQVVFRLELIKEWLEHVDGMQQHAVDLSSVKRLMGELLKEIDNLLSQLSWQTRTGGPLLRMMLHRMKTRLMGTPAAMHFTGLLHTGCIRQTDEGLPIIDATLNTVQFQEPWRLVLWHILTPVRPLEDVVDEILGNPVADPIGVQDNLHQLTLIGRYLGSDSERHQISQVQKKEAMDAAQVRMRDFRASLELAYTYDRISESDKESLLQMMEHYQPIFLKDCDFACWHRFIDALTMQVDACAEQRRQKLRSRLSAMRGSQPDSHLLKEAERLLEQEMNFAVAEEYMNRVDGGAQEHDEELATILNDPDYFCNFISPEVFDSLYHECSKNNGRPFRNFAQHYVERNAPEDWTSRHFESSKDLYMNWPSGRGRTSPSVIQKLFSAIGFDVVGATLDPRHREEVFQLTVRPTPCSMADYRHPIAAFGTLLKSPLNVVVLYGNYTERQLVDAVTSLDLREMSVVLLDRPYSVSQRRNVGEIFHTQTSGINPFILIDQVLALYLALHQITERMSAMLKCTLPFTIYNPFVHDGGPTADEMFFGRAQELRSILDPNGACVVYGGRQLGKSALLARAESLFSKPEEKRFAAKVTTYQCHSEEQFVAQITHALNARTNGMITFTGCTTIKDFATQLEAMYRKGVFRELLLLIDEADDFLDAIATDNYDQLWPLVDLRNYTKRSFKIVLAGLHNVYRAQSAEQVNSVFAQLGTSLCVKPLSPADALQLLTRPLNYLGFRIDQIQHMETILTNTNYYPGILQFFGYKLVEAMTTEYSRYYRAVGDNPPFSLKDEQLGAVMSSADLNNSIHHKFRLSLELDPRYYMIARCIAMLCHLYEEDSTALNWMGYSVQQVQQIVQEYDIHCLAAADRRTYLLLMDEMVSMGILSCTSEGRYRLRRSSFIDVIGRDMNALEAEIIEANGGDAV